MVGTSWGTLPSAMHPQWEALSCNSMVRAASQTDRDAAANCSGAADCWPTACSNSSLLAEQCRHACGLCEWSPPPSAPPLPPKSPLPPHVDGTGQEERSVARRDLLTVQCSGRFDSTDILGACGGHCGGFGACLNRVLHHAHDALLSGYAAHNNRFHLGICANHGILADATRCPSQDASCFWVRTHDRCAQLSQSHSAAEVDAAAARLRCAHPYVVYGELHHLLYEPNEWLQQQIDVMASFASTYDGPYIGIHVRRGDRQQVPNSNEGMRMPSNAHIAAMLQRYANAAENIVEGETRQIWLMSDDSSSPAGIAAHLESTPELQVTYFDLGERSGRTCSRPNLCTSVVSTELGAFLFGGFLLISRARVVISNTNSNLGVLVDTLAETHSQWDTTPIMVDMDLRVTIAALEEGKFWCNPEWGSRHGLCPAGVANNCQPPWDALWHAPESLSDDAIISAPCTPSMRATCPTPQGRRLVDTTSSPHYCGTGSTRQSSSCQPLPLWVRTWGSIA